MNQLLIVDLELHKPIKLKDGTENPFFAFAVHFPLQVYVTVRALKPNDVQLYDVAANVSHTRTVFCHANTDKCTPMTILSESFLHYNRYFLEVTLVRPFEAFGEFSSQIAPQVGFSMEGTYVQGEYTQFEVGWRYFFFTASLMLFALYLYTLCTRSDRSRWSLEQKWSLALLISLAMFNNPFILIAVYDPGLTWSSLNVFFTTTFVVLLLLFWLVEMHVVVIAASRRHSTSANLELGAGFYLPKAIFMTLFFAFALLGALYVLYQLSEDPSFSVWQDTPFPHLVFGMAGALVGLYLVWIVVLAGFAIAAAIRRQLSKQFLLFVAMTITAMIAVVASYYAGGINGQPTETVVFLTLYATANVYLWLLVFAHVPGVSPQGGGAFSSAMDSERRATESTARASEEAGVLDGVLEEADASAILAKLDEPEASRRGAAQPSFSIGDEDDDGEDLAGGNPVV
jgi:hypothetical protein